MSKKIKPSAFSIKLDIEYLLPLLDLYTSLLIAKIGGFGKIDLDAYAEQSKIYMHGSSDYSKLIGETGPIQYPAASLYIYSMFNWITNYNITM